MQHPNCPQSLYAIFNKALYTGQIPKEICGHNTNPQKEFKGGCGKLLAHLAPVHSEQISGATGFQLPL